MSKTIDQRVVEMRFDNENFEKNVRTTMDTLDALSQKIDSSTSGEKLAGISNAFNNINITPLSNSLDAVSVKFSALQTISDTVIRSITNGVISATKKIGSIINKPLQLIEEGGKRRAQNIENAKFQLEGLGVQWSEIKDDLDYGVKDTAYGLDAAAKVASQLVASQVKLGEEMQTSLRAVSGVAAMTNSSYEDIGHIFTTIAGNGRLMGMQLTQLSGKGLNVAATLAESMGTTEAAVREMVSKGQIDFKTFAKAMDDAFGEHAKDANKTFEGALSNVKSALSRLGADTASAGFEGLRRIFVSLIDVLNNFKKVAQPVLDVVSKKILEFSDLAVMGINHLNEIVQSSGLGSFFRTLASNITRSSNDAYYSLSRFISLKGIENILEGITNGFKALQLIIRPIKNAFKTVFPDSTESLLVSLSEKFRDFNKQLWITTDSQNGLYVTFTYIFTFIKKIGSAITTFVKLISPAVDSLRSFGGALLAAIGSGTYDTEFNLLSTGFDKIGTALSFCITKLVEFSDKLKGISFESIADRLINVADKIKNSKIVTTISELFENVHEYISNLGTNLKPLFGIVKELTSQIFASLSEMFTDFGGASFTDIINSGMFLTFILQLKEAIGTLRGITGQASGILTLVKKNLSIFTREMDLMQAKLNADVLLAIAKAIGILAVSMLLISVIDTDKMVTALAGMAGGFVLLINVLKSLTTDIKGILGTGALVLLSGALLTLTASLLVLSLIPMDKMVVGLGGLAGGLFIIRAALTGMEATIPGALALTIVGAGLIALAAAMLILSKIEMKNIGTALVVLGGSLLLLALGLTAMVYALPGAVALTVAAGALMLLVPALLLLSKFDGNKLATTLLLLGGALGELSIGLSLMVLAVPGSRALEIASRGLLILAPALLAISKIDGKDVGKTLLLLGGSLAAVSAGLNTMIFALPGAAALRVAVGALLLMVPVLKAIGGMEGTQIKMALLGIVGAFAALGASSLLLAPLTPVLMLISTSILILGMGVLQAGLGITLLASGLAVVAAVGSVALSIFVKAFKEIVEYIPVVIEKIGEGIIAFAKVIRDGAPVIADAIMAVFYETLRVIDEKFPKIVETIVKMMKSINDHRDEFDAIGAEFINYLLKGITDTAYKITESAVDLIVAFMNAIGEKYGEVAQAGWDLVINIIDGMSDSIVKNTPRLKESVERLLQTVADSMIEFTNLKMPNVGGNLVSGLIKGITGHVPFVNTAIDKLTSGILERFSKGLDEHSPSKATEKNGLYFDEGFVNGIGKGKTNILDSISGLGITVLEKFKSAIGMLDTTEIAPTVTPVLDFSKLSTDDAKFDNIIANKSFDLTKAINFGNNAVQSVNNVVNDNREVVMAINNLQNKIDELGNKMSNLKVVMDSGRLVGEISADVNRSLGSRTIQYQRQTGSRNIGYQRRYS